MSASIHWIPLVLGKGFAELPPRLEMGDRRVEKLLRSPP